MSPSKAARAAPARCGNDPRNEQLGGRLDPSNSEKSIRLQHLAAALHALGPRPLFEFLREIEAGADVRQRLEVYAALPVALIRGYGGDQFAPALFAIRGGRE